MKEKIDRIISIDIIRGYFLFVILVDHFGRNFSVYDLFTGGGQQWVSAAEGFFFVSGIMIGLVRGRKLIDQPLSVVTKKVWLRALQLYIWAIGLTLFFTIVAQFFIGNTGLKAGAFHNEPLQKLVSYTLMLRYNYGWADFLNYYAIYLLATPLALWLLRIKKWYVLLAGSFLLWIFGNNLQFTWQILFFSGVIAGFYLPDIEAWFKRLSQQTRRYIYISFTTAGLSTIAISMFFNNAIDVFNRATNNFNPLGDWSLRLYDFNTYFLASYFDKYSLGYGRLILFFIWFIMLYLLVRRYEKTVNKVVGWYFVPLGQNSLYVYIVHAVAIFFINLFLPTNLPVWLNIVVTTLFLACVWLLVKKKVLFGIIPR